MLYQDAIKRFLSNFQEPVIPYKDFELLMTKESEVELAHAVV